LGEYVDVIGYPGYKINKEGEIISYKKVHPKKLKPYIAGNGYYEVALSPEKGVYKRLGVHRLVAINFIPNPDNLPQVNHKDGNTLNYSADNLEWVSASENTLHHIYELENGEKKRRIIIVDGIEFPSLKACAKYFNISAKNLSSQLAKGIIPRALRGKEIIFK
jgi:hypothetical protein